MVPLGFCPHSFLDSAIIISADTQLSVLFIPQDLVLVPPILETRFQLPFLELLLS